MSSMVKVSLALAVALAATAGHAQEPRRRTPANSVAVKRSLSVPAPTPIKAAAPASTPPRTPDGLPRCSETLKPTADLPRDTGETIRYLVDLNGLSVGTIDFKIERQGTYEGQPVTEYRSLFKLDSLVSSFVPVEGRAASLVPASSFAPLVAMNRYRLDENEFEENVSFSADGRRVASVRTKNGKSKDEERAFPGPALDFVSGFYMFRSMPPLAEGCTILYGNQRAYTVWVKYEGDEQVRTPVGYKPARRYRVRYASDRSKKPLDGKVWLSAAGDRLPFKATIDGPEKLEARIHHYEVGR